MPLKQHTPSTCRIHFIFKLSYQLYDVAVHAISWIGQKRQTILRISTSYTVVNVIATIKWTRQPANAGRKRLQLLRNANWLYVWHCLLRENICLKSTMFTGTSRVFWTALRSNRMYLVIHDKKTHLLIELTVRNGIWLRMYFFRSVLNWTRACVAFSCYRLQLYA